MTQYTAYPGAPRAGRPRLKFTTRLCVTVGVGALALMGAMAPVSASSPTVGTWQLDPAQTFHDTTVTSTGSIYKAVVRPPINADGSSNFTAKRGVIPVQFDLLAAPSTSTTTTRTYDPPVWKSIGSEGSYTLAVFTPTSSLTFNQVTNLSADYLFTEGTCGGGSLRWTVAVNHDGVEKHVDAYYGDPGGVQECSTHSGSGQDLISTGTAPNRFEVFQSGTYTTYVDAQTAAGSDPVLWVALILDSGWMLDQRANVSNITVNDNTFVPQTTTTTTTTNTTGAYVNTCDLPAAKLRWSKDDPTPSGAINEAESIQPKDTGEYYRQVDCKYIYNLAVTSLSGQGTYRVYANLDGANLDAPAKFDLR
jgi:hypothetical protein